MLLYLSAFSKVFHDSDKVDIIRCFTRCLQCSEEGKLILQNEVNKLCGKCFIKVLIDRFDTYFKKRKISLNQNILLVQSQSNVSVGLLHLLKSSIQSNSTNYTVSKVYCLYINESINLKESFENHMKIFSFATRARYCGFTVYVASFNNFILERNSYFQKFNLVKRNKNLKIPQVSNVILEKMNNNTGKEDFLKKLRNKLILQLSRRLNCKVILFSDVATDIATEILNSTILGEGINYYFQNISINNGINHVNCLYPMTIFSQYEVNNFLKLCNYKNTKFDKTVANLDSNPAIQNTTKRLILNLYLNNLSISAIVKLSEKINFNNLDFSLIKYCFFCNRLIKNVLASDKILNKFINNFPALMSKLGESSKIFIKLPNLKCKKPIKVYSNLNFKAALFNNYYINNKYSLSVKECLTNIDICYACTVFFHKLVI